MCILSTYPVGKGEYGTISGTSMASPHAAGALALLASSNNPGNATDVYALYDAVKGASSSNWTDDSGDTIHEPLLDVTSTSLFKPVLVAGSGWRRQRKPAADSSFAHQCTDLDCSFDASNSADTDGSITSYAWDCGDGTSGSGETASPTYTASGTHTVALTVTDDDGATGFTSQSVTVSASTTVTTLSGSSTSQGSTRTAIATYSGAAGTFSGSWSNGGTGSCEIETAGNSCTVEKPGIAKRVPSVTWTAENPNLGSVAITEP